MKDIDALSKRLEAAALARQRLVKLFEDRPKSDDPAVVARADQRRTVDEARLKRKAARLAERAAKLAEETARRDALEEAALAQQILEVEQQIELQAADYAARKARRDQRYADRKQRSRGTQISR